MDAVDAEILDVIVGGRPVKFDEDDKDAPKEPVKQMFLDILKEQYDVEEEDFLSAEIEVVPAGPARDMGLDRSMILGYGHDDRVCAYPSMLAQINVADVERTSITLIVDKEEIGSMGVTGMQSAAFDAFMSDLCDGQNVPLKACFENAFCLSADVTAAFDPNFADVYEKRNSARINYGMGLCKYTGARGKSGASDAAGEVMARFRRAFSRGGVCWQAAELGKVLEAFLQLGKIDAGGGGTVAQYMANRNIATLDAGVPVLSMHAPFEVVAKVDCYEMYRACKALYEAR